MIRRRSLLWFGVLAAMAAILLVAAVTVANTDHNSLVPNTFDQTTIGDVTLNGIPFEIADIVLFTNYLLYGQAAFTIDPEAQLAATDYNGDGKPATMSDFVCMIRIAMGESPPNSTYWSVWASITVERGVFNIDTEVGAAYLTLKGNIRPTLYARNMDMNYHYDGTNTRILISSIEGNSAEGPLVYLGRPDLDLTDFVSLDAATPDGENISPKARPVQYVLKQNYPNPFNPSTTISFAIAFATDYELTVTNVRGQTVDRWTGYAEAGVVEEKWNGADHPSGVYFYRLDINGQSSTRKMVLLK